MAEEKKDLTGIVEYAKVLESSGQAPALPEGAVMEQVPIEKIDDFESLEAYAQANPEAIAPEASQEEAPAIPGETSDTPAAQPVDDFPVTSMEEPPPPMETDFAVTPPEEPADFISPPAEQPAFETPAPEVLEAEAPVSPPPAEVAPENDNQPLDFAPPPPAEEPAALEPPPPVTAKAEEPNPLPPLKPATPPLQQVREYSNQVITSKPAVPAAFPFSLYINGPLRPEEQARLLDILARENMGIREIDLEPQLQSEKILIPRISEYAAIIIVQALRGARAQIKMGPSDSVFSTQETQAQPDDPFPDSEEKIANYTGESDHPAEEIPITTESQLPGLSHLIDTIAVSGLLKSRYVEVEQTADYQDLIESLQREIKYKAYRRGAHGIVGFKIQLQSLPTPTHYRMIAFGQAVKPPAPPSAETAIQLESN